MYGVCHGSYSSSQLYTVVAGLSDVNADGIDCCSPFKLVKNSLMGWEAFGPFIPISI